MAKKRKQMCSSNSMDEHDARKDALEALISKGESNEGSKMPRRSEPKSDKESKLEEKRKRIKELLSKR